MRNKFLKILLFGKADCLWQYVSSAGGEAVRIAAPVFEINGRRVSAALKDVYPCRSPVQLRNGVVEHAYEGTLRADPGLTLEMIFRVAPDNPVVRFRYILKARPGITRCMTKRSSADNLSYLAIPLKAWPQCTEIRISEFDESVHSFCLREIELAQKDFDNRLAVMGPILAAEDGRRAILLAYEHGSQVPDAFIAYDLGSNRRVALRAIKGNYWQNRLVDASHPYETIWLQAAVVDGDRAALAHHYRHFVLRRMTENQASRTPFLFYNTWAFQERNCCWNGKKYLDSMTQKRILAEIDVAHRMGIDVFVLDTGWYGKTGDWQVNLNRFPDGLKTVRERLDRHGMKLGLWFAPPQAALTSRIHANHRDCLMSWRGKVYDPAEIWETEKSQSFCLVSRYWQAFADELIRLVREVGVTYFKWDAVGQYGCDAAGHFHGAKDVPATQRADCYAFEQVRYMTRIVDRLCAACPETIVDFDITEGGRSVGLAFLSAGKYFLINNGPYYQNYDIPRDGRTSSMWSNIFVHPGPARGWICRAPLSLDRWIPSVLYLTHYLPDDPKESQLINLASLILGQNGIWGDLLKVSKAGVKLFATILGIYKRVQNEITESDPIVTGSPGGSPEIHEKIAANGRGMVVIFASAAGRYTYVTHRRTTSSHWATEGVTMKRDINGRARIDCTFEKAGAKIIFFGVR